MDEPLKHVGSKIFSATLDSTGRSTQASKWFDRFDKTGKGKITLKEFKEGMMKSSNLNETQIENIFKKLDFRNRGIISKDEFVDAIAFDAMTSVDERLKAVFEAIDKDNDLKLGKNELSKILDDFQLKDYCYVTAFFFVCVFLYVFFCMFFVVFLSFFCLFCTMICLFVCI